MNFDVNGYDTRGTEGMNVYLPKLTKDIDKNSFWYKGGQMLNCLSDVVKDSPNLEAFKYYKLQKNASDTLILYYFIYVFFLTMERLLMYCLVLVFNCTYVGVYLEE